MSDIKEMLRTIFGKRYVGLRETRRQNCIGVCVTHMYKTDTEELKRYNYEIVKWQASTFSSIIIAIKKIK